MQQAPQFKPSPEQIVAFLFKNSKPKGVMSFRDKRDTLRFVARATTSLPVMTIATRDRIEAEMLARRRADQNLEDYGVSVVSSTSPETLDG